MTLARGLKKPVNFTLSEDKLQELDKVIEDFNKLLLKDGYKKVTRSSIIDSEFNLLLTSVKNKLEDYKNERKE